MIKRTIVFFLLLYAAFFCFQQQGRSAGWLPLAKVLTGPIVFDNVASNSATNNAATTLTISYTAVGTLTAGAVGFQLFNATVVSVTWGAVSCALPAGGHVTDPGGVDEYLYGCANPPSGTQTITITMNQVGNYIEAGAIGVTGSNTSTVFNHVLGATGTSSGPTVTVASGTGELVVDVLGAHTTITGSNQTLRWGPLAASGDQAAGSTAAGSANVTMSYTINVSDNWGIVSAGFHL